MTDPSSEYDVIVVGAGASGIPAAIAAARAGARVLLLEEDSLPGGAPVDMYVTLLCGGPRVGIFLDMANRLNRKHRLFDMQGRPFEDGGCHEPSSHWYLPSAYVDVLLEMLAEAKNVTLICGVRVTRTLVEDAGQRRRVCGVVLKASDGSTRRYVAPITIDATGTGEIAASAGCETQYGRNARSEFGEAYGPAVADTVVQPCTWMYVSQRFRPDARLPTEKISGGILEPKFGWMDDRCDPAVRERNGDLFLHWGPTMACVDTRDPEAVARAQHEAFEQFRPEMVALQASGFAVHLAPKLGIREVRRVMGEAVVTATDLLDGRYPEDTIAHCEFFLDAWGEHDQLPRTPVAAGIPYGALVPRDVEGLLVAGKAISGTHLAMSAYRVQPSIASIGTAAGLAAAQAASRRTTVRSIDLMTLQDQLRAMGVIR